MKPNDQEIQTFAQKFAAAKNAGASLTLTARELEIIDYSLITLVSQAEIIDQLKRQLVIAQIYQAAAVRNIADAGTDKLKSLYAGARLNDFTMDVANSRINEVLQEITQQNQLQDTIGTVAKFAVKFAPLLLV